MARPGRSENGGAGRMSRRSATATPPPTRRAAVGWLAAPLAIAGSAVYWNALSVPFTLDDQLSVFYNSSIRHLWPPSSLFLAEQDSPSAGRPLVNISLALNSAAGGLQARGYHVWNLAVHLLCALSIFGIVRRSFELPIL